MKKVVLLILMTVGVITLGACSKKEVKETTQTKESSAVTMMKVEGNSQSPQAEIIDTNEETKATKESSEKEIVDVKKLLNDFGNAYANYNSINDRNEKLKKLMTDECIKKNGINFDSAVKLASKGKITGIYQPMDVEKDQYAILLTCEQNGTEVRVLLLVKVTGNKISEMTYNTVKQEY